MRGWVIAGLFGLALLQPLQARAASRHSGALPLVISAVGSVHNPPDKITLTVGLSGAAESDAAKIAKLRRLLTVEGVSPSGIVDAASPHGAGKIGGRFANESIRVLIDDPKIYPKVRKVLIEQGVVLLAPPLFELKDVSAAKAAAVTDAIQKAQTEADIYAAAAGNRVIRVTKIQNSAPTRNVESGPKAAIHTPAATLPAELPDVVTEAPVTLTFAMVPG
jgi:uncharacterized protein YggE